jgi:FkbM family methyltransferase
VIKYEDMQPPYMVAPKVSERNFNFVKNCLPLIKKKKKVKIIFDIGANAGVLTACFCELFPNAHVYAFEPVSSTYDYLVSNINNLGLTDRVSCFNIGFWKRKCTKTLGMPESRRKDPENIGLYSVYGTDNPVRVNFEILDNWCNEHNIWPNLIKLDCEGAEPKIIKGGHLALKSARYLITELSPINKKILFKLLNPIFNCQKYPLSKGKKFGDRLWIKK